MKNKQKQTKTNNKTEFVFDMIGNIIFIIIGAFLSVINITWLIQTIRSGYGPWQLYLIVLLMGAYLIYHSIGEIKKLFTDKTEVTGPAEDNDPYVSEEAWKTEKEGVTIKTEGKEKQPETEMAGNSYNEEPAEESKGIPVWKKLEATEPTFERNLRVTITVILFIIALAGVLLGIISGIWRFAIAGALVGIIAFMVKGRDKKHITEMVFLLIIYCVIMSIIQVYALNSNCSWIYPFQRDYISTLRNTVEPDWFPDKMEDVEGNFQFRYMMGFQDPGYYSVSYETTPEYIYELLKTYEPLSETAYSEALEKYGTEGKYTYHENAAFWGYGESNNSEPWNYYEDYYEDEGIACPYGDYHKVLYMKYRSTVSTENTYGDPYYCCDVLILDISTDENGKEIGRVEFRGQ